MNRILSIIIALILGFQAVAMDSAEILKKAEAFKGDFGESFVMTVNLKSYIAGRFSEEETYSGYFEGQNKSLLKCKEGNNKGLKLLMVKPKMWVHVEGTRRPIRITPVQKLMGDASNGDVASVSFLEDYTVESNEIGEGFYILNLKAVSTAATYNKVKYFVEKNSFRPVRAEFLLSSGKHFKTMTYLEFDSAGMKKVRIDDETRKGRYTVLEYTNQKEQDIPGKMFNPVNLVNIKGI